MKRLRDEARRWEISSTRDGEGRVRAQAIYRWTNASRGNGQTGAMFVWTFEGVGGAGVFSIGGGPSRHHAQFHALRAMDHKTQDSIMVARGGVPLQSIPDPPAPAAIAKQRAIQMREIA